MRRTDATLMLNPSILSPTLLLLIWAGPAVPERPSCVAHHPQEELQGFSAFPKSADKWIFIPDQARQQN